jgi:hypothetical protein
MPNIIRVLVETAAGVYQAGTLIRPDVALPIGQAAVLVDGDQQFTFFPSERVIRAPREEAKTREIPRETLAEVAADYERQWKAGAR